MTTQVDTKKKKKSDNKKTSLITAIVGSSELAEICNVTERRIQQLTGFTDEIDSHVFEPLTDKKPYQYDLKTSVKNFIRYQQEQLNGKKNKLENIKREGSKLDADVEIKQLKIKAEKLKLAELEGNMHRSDDVRDMTDDLVLSIRAMLLALPSRLAEDLIDISDSRETRKILKDEVLVILGHLKNYKYDPKAYKEKVNERNKRDVNSYDDDEDDY